MYFYTDVYVSFLCFIQLIRDMEAKAKVGNRAIIICATGNCTAQDLVEHRQNGLDLTWVSGTVPVGKL